MFTRGKARRTAGSCRHEIGADRWAIAAELCEHGRCQCGWCEIPSAQLQHRCRDGRRQSSRIPSCVAQSLLPIRHLASFSVTEPGAQAMPLSLFLIMLRVCDGGHDAVKDALALARGEKPGQRPGGG